MRAVIYARYSTDLQSHASIEDQVRLCRTRIGAEGWTLLNTYTDHALSGASRLRPGYQKLLEDARAGLFDVVVAEALDRLSRDQEDTAALYKQLGFSGVRLVTLAEGEISELHVGLKGTMNALFLKDLAMKTRRGLEGRVRQGRSGGGLCYGYRVAAERDAAGNPIPGGRLIDKAEADIVVRIFREYAAGRSPREIARRLNADGIPGPGGRPWGDTTIRGHALRGTGVLHNELYVGRLVWNRQRYIKAHRARPLRRLQQAAGGSRARLSRLWRGAPPGRLRQSEGDPPRAAGEHHPGRFARPADAARSRRRVRRRLAAGGQPAARRRRRRPRTHRARTCAGRAQAGRTGRSDRGGPARALAAADAR
jgi:DNA invertase Pin-like site-specific DNA recombinase